MKRAASVAAAFCLCLVSRPAAAEEQRVVVLMARALPAAPWPEGTQAVIAELAASHYQVIVESTAANDLRELLGELRKAANEADNAGAISVVRDRGAGIAYVWTRHDANVVQVQSERTEGAVSEGALALRVLELIRARALRLPEPEPEPEPPPPKKAEKPKSLRPKPAAPEPPPRDPRNALLWLGAGPSFAAGAPNPLVQVTLGARFAVSRPLFLDADAQVSVAPIGLDTRAGHVDVSARKLSLHLVLEPWHLAPFRFGFGAGGGAVWLSETAQAANGFAAHSDNAYLALASGYASAALQSGDISFVVAFEPGLLLRGASVRANGEELVYLGNAYTSITAGIGWTP